MVSMNSNAQNGAGNVVGSTGTVTGSSCGLESGPSRTELSQSVVECHNNNNTNNNNNANRNCNNSADTSGPWKLDLLQQDPGKMSKLREIVENNTSVTSKCVVESLLQQVNQLSDVEKLLLYLKLPVGRSPDLDPLKQPLNPLGSRSEIQLTITWMKTHLEKDLEVSLPKEEVYNEYMEHFTSNGMKPLSTADFGKVMKQVFPSVRARRLGHRGASKYCHSGLRKKYMLDVPFLPDVSENSSSTGGSTNKNSFGLGVPCDESQRASLCIIMEWAEKFCNIKFETFRDLALYLIEKNYVDNRSVAAFTLLAMDQRAGNSVGKHRETQVQLQKKLQEREQFREQKRKLQEQQSGVSKSLSDRPKTRRRSGTTRNSAATGDAANNNGRNSATAAPFDSSKACVAGGLGGVQDSKQPLATSHNGRFELDQGSTKRDSLSSTVAGIEEGEKGRALVATIKQEDSSGRIAFPSLFLADNKDAKTDHLGHNAMGDTHQKYLRTPSTDEAVTNGPTLVKGTPTNVTAAAAAVPKTYCILSNLPPSNNGLGSSNGCTKNRYKPIQPKVCEANNNTVSSNNNTVPNSNNNGVANKNKLNGNAIVPGQWPEVHSQNIDTFRPQVETGVGLLPQSTPTDYYHSGPTPQNQRSSVDQEDFTAAAHGSNEAKQLSELRMMLQKNLPSRSGPCIGMGSEPLGLEDPSADLDSDSGATAAIRRRVSFQTSVEGCDGTALNPFFGPANGGQVLSAGVPSCTKAYNFTPIPHPAPGGGVSQGVSQASSANASPFMSPRNTPLPRSRHNSGQTSSTYVTPRSTPYTPDLGQACGGIPSESSTPFMSPAPTPLLSRSRHNSSQNLRTCRSRHSSGAPSYRHTPYADDRRGNKFRSRHSSGSIPPSPQSAPLSPLVHDSSPHPLPDQLLFHHHQQQQMGGPSGGPGLPLKHQPQQGQLGACNDLRRRHMSAGPTIHYQPQTQPPPHSFGIASSCVGTDLLSQEVSSVMTNPLVGMGGGPPVGSTNRPQSVPLPQMLQTSSCGSDMDCLAKSHPSTPLVGLPFHFGSDCSVSTSHPPSYAPTPVPSEYNDFCEYSNLDFDPVFGGDTGSVNTGATLEAIESSSFSNFENTLSESLAGTPSGVGPLTDATFGDCGAAAAAARLYSSREYFMNSRTTQPSNEFPASRSNAPPPSSGGKEGGGDGGGSCHQPRDPNNTCSKGEQPPSTQPLIFNSSSQITLNALNAHHVLGLQMPDTTLGPPSSDLEDDFQPSLVDFNDEDVFNSLVHDVNKD